MRAARYYDREDVRIEETEEAIVGSGQVRVEIETCGICGSDLHEYVHGPVSIPSDPHPVTGDRIPITIGHEFGGTIVETGDEVDIPIGTEVAVNPMIWCGECRYCLEGTYRLCTSRGYIGLSGGGGGFTENAVVPAETAIPLPDGVSLDYAALVEPFTVGLHAVRRSGVRPGDAVAIFGTGPIGLTVLQAARAAGAGPIVVSEPRTARRDLAVASGADIGIDPTETDPVASIADMTDGGVDVSFEVAGVPQTVNQSMQATKRGGTITIVSLFKDDVTIELDQIVTAERQVYGSAAYRGGPLSHREFGATLRYFEDGTFDPAQLVTSEILLEDIVERGFERLRDPESDEVKILVTT